MQANENNLNNCCKKEGCGVLEKERKSQSLKLPHLSCSFSGGGGGGGGQKEIFSAAQYDQQKFPLTFFWIWQNESGIFLTALKLEGVQSTRFCIEPHCSMQGKTSTPWSYSRALCDCEWEVHIHLPFAPTAGRGREAACRQGEALSKN